MTTVAKIALSAAEDRLERLIDERLAPGADTAAVDRRIWDLFGETWTVMFTDLSGFSRNVAEFGIIHFLQTIQESQRLFTPIIEAHQGFLLKTEGDSLLVIFRSPRRALDCAKRMRAAAEDYNALRAPEEKVLLCVGLGHGPVLRVSDHDVFGAEVNAASRLGEDLAGPGDILVTEGMKRALGRTPERFARLPKAPSGAKAAYRLTPA